MINTNRTVDPSKYEEYEKKTIQTYNSAAKKWTKAHEFVNDWEEEFKHFQKKFLHSGSIIELGCGSGRDAKILLGLGYNYLGIDASRALLEVAKKSVPMAKFRLLNFYDLKGINQKFDGFVSVASLLHIPRKKVDNVLQDIRNLLRKDAVGLITLKDGEGEIFETRDIDGRHEERLFTFWNRSDFEVVLSSVGFEIMDYSLRPIGRSNWHCFIVKKLN